MKKIFHVLFLLLLPLTVWGQTPVTVTGTITDAGNNPITSGYVQFDIIPTSSSVQYYILGIGTITQTVQCGINGTGQIQNIGLTGACTVWGNDLILPANTQYRVTFAPNNVVTNRVSGECITGANYSLNSPVFCPQVVISPQTGIIRSNPFQTNILPITGSVFNIGSPQFPYAGIYAGSLFLGGVQFSTANVAFLNVNNVFTGATNTFNNTLVAGSIQPTFNVAPFGAQNNIGPWFNIHGYAIALHRSQGLTTTADILGDGVDPLVIAGKSDGSGIVSLGATAALRSGAPNSALTGVIRLANTDAVKSRNAGNSADVNLTSLDAFNNLILGDSGILQVLIKGSTPGALSLTPSVIMGAADTALSIQAQSIGNPGQNINLSASSAQATANNGGSVNITAGNGGAPAGTGGNILLSPGGGATAKGVVQVAAGFLYYPPTFTFATLGAPSNGALVYCSDCTIANPCAGAGSGAIAKRLNGVWVCN